MQQKNFIPARRQDTRARDLALFKATGPQPEGALVTGETADDGRIAVVYSQGKTPPEITIAGGTGAVQTIMADGVAVAVVARANGPRLTRQDVMLVERFVA